MPADHSLNSVRLRTVYSHERTACGKDQVGLTFAINILRVIFPAVELHYSFRV